MEPEAAMGRPLLEEGTKKQTTKSQQSMRCLWCLLGVMLPGLFLLSFIAKAYVLEGRLPRDLIFSAASADADTALRTLSEFEVIHFTGSADSAEEALARVVPHVSSFFVVTLGPHTPARRTAEQRVLSCTPSVTLPCAELSAAAEGLEAVLGSDAQGQPRRLFPLSLGTADFSSHWSMAAGVVRPYVVWEAGSGRVLVDSGLAGRLWGSPGHVTSGQGAPGDAGALEPEPGQVVGTMSVLMATGLFRHLATALPQVAAATAGPAVSRLSTLMHPALALAVAGAFAAAPPLWFCIVCPAVLGLLAPLAINMALNQLAGHLCTSLALPDDQCFDLLVGALGLGFVLSLASAVPIFYACKLMECARRGDTPPPAAAAAPAGARGPVAVLTRVLGIKGGGHQGSVARRRAWM
uniref:Uncharacterized protein n=1 Tax=Chlamydomonas leiostraca TaxID=1034604 RepID=A0A7S0S0Y9_9CHLO|mmetsp:Transcript_37553/g.94800  ORF Transcript_37553/g.94800 Transcript_37553/m.94800 type:complete len:408 (+) Transcript_37553:49-1272(+)